MYKQRQLRSVWTIRHGIKYIYKDKNEKKNTKQTNKQTKKKTTKLKRCKKARSEKKKPNSTEIPPWLLHKVTDNIPLLFMPGMENALKKENVRAALAMSVFRTRVFMV